MPCYEIVLVSEFSEALLELLENLRAHQSAAADETEAMRAKRDGMREREEDGGSDDDDETRAKTTTTEAEANAAEANAAAGDDAARGRGGRSETRERRG